MSILYNKLVEHYGIKTLNSMFDYRTLKKIKDVEKIKITTITNSKQIKFDKINYTYINFMSDFKDMKKYKESKIVFEIYKKGFSLSSYAKKNHFHVDSFINALKKGINYNRRSHLDYFYEFIPKKLNLNDFKISLYDSHCELYGEYDRLVLFRTNNKIKDEVMFDKFKNSYHIAFNNKTCEFIKKYKNKKGNSKKELPNNQ